MPVTFIKWAILVVYSHFPLMTSNLRLVIFCL
jgi:hypothetical protein